MNKRGKIQIYESKVWQDCVVKSRSPDYYYSLSVHDATQSEWECVPADIVRLVGVLPCQCKITGLFEGKDSNNVWHKISIVEQLRYNMECFSVIVYDDWGETSWPELHNSNIRVSKVPEECFFQPAIFEGRDANGNWWPVVVTGKVNTDNNYVVKLNDLHRDLELQLVPTKCLRFVPPPIAKKNAENEKPKRTPTADSSRRPVNEVSEGSRQAERRLKSYPARQRSPPKKTSHQKMIEFDKRRRAAEQKRPKSVAPAAPDPERQNLQSNTNVSPWQSTRNNIQPAERTSRPASERSARPTTDVKETTPRKASVPRSLSRNSKRVTRTPGGPTPIPMKRFATFFNLTVRYWDEGKVDLAKIVAQNALNWLVRYNLPEGCARHQMDIILQCEQTFRARERALKKRLKAHPNSIKAQYDTAVLHFDKRQFTAAEQQLRASQITMKLHGKMALTKNTGLASSKAREVSERVQSENDAAIHAQKLSQIAQDLEGVEDDLCVVRELRKQFCAEGDELRAMTAEERKKCPALLPCLCLRFDESMQSACDQWSRMLAEHPAVDFTI